MHNLSPRYTVAEVAVKLEVEKEIARGLMKFLMEVGLCEWKGDRKSDGPGKAEHVYSFKDGYEKRLQEMLEESTLSS